MDRRSANRPWNLLVNSLAASPFLLGERREWLYRLGGIDPNGTSIRPGCWFMSDKISFGPNGMVNRGCKFENRQAIKVGARCYFGPEVLVLTSTHQVGSPWQRAGDYEGRPVEIGDGCWIGARATILPGVSVAPGCVIAAGAVVVGETDPGGFYGGVPARHLPALTRSGSAVRQEWDLAGPGDGGGASGQRGRGAAPRPAGTLVSRSPRW